MLQTRAMGRDIARGILVIGLVGACIEVKEAPDNQPADPPAVEDEAVTPRVERPPSTPEPIVRVAEWPSMETLRRHTRFTLPVDTAPEDVAAWFFQPGHGNQPVDVECGADGECFMAVSDAVPAGRGQLWIGTGAPVLVRMQTTLVDDAPFIRLSARPAGLTWPASAPIEAEIVALEDSLGVTVWEWGIDGDPDFESVTSSVGAGIHYIYGRATLTDGSVIEHRRHFEVGPPVPTVVWDSGVASNHREQSWVDGQRMLRSGVELVDWDTGAVLRTWQPSGSSTGHAYGVVHGDDVWLVRWQESVCHASLTEPGMICWSLEEIFGPVEISPTSPHRLFVLGDEAHIGALTLSDTGYHQLEARLKPGFETVEVDEWPSCAHSDPCYFGTVQLSADRIVRRFHTWPDGEPGQSDPTVLLEVYGPDGLVEELSGPMGTAPMLLPDGTVTTDAALGFSGGWLTEAYHDGSLTISEFETGACHVLRDGQWETIDVGDGPAWRQCTLLENGDVVVRTPGAFSYVRSGEALWTLEAPFVALQGGGSITVGAGARWDFDFDLTPKPRLWAPWSRPL